VINKPDQYVFYQASFWLSHTFSNQSSLEISTQYLHYQQHYPNDFLFLISYTIPFGLPIARRTDIGNLTGSVFDIEKGGPIPEALVHIGENQSWTDAQGNFTFQNMRSGTHNVNVEILPKQLITENLLPQSITITGGRRTHVAIPVVSTCNITGEIIQYIPPEAIDRLIHQNLSMKTEPLKGMQITIQRNHGEEIYITTSNEKGVFRFSNLRPGTWSVHVSTDLLPESYFLQTNPITLHLIPQEKKELIFKVLPRISEIHPIEKGVSNNKIEQEQDFNDKKNEVIELPS
jgi:hypothetical protein